MSFLKITYIKLKIFYQKELNLIQKELSNYLQW